MTQNIHALAQSLNSQLADIRSHPWEMADSQEPEASQELHANLQALLELLGDATQDEARLQSSQPRSSASSTETAASLVKTIEHTLAAWQAQISTAYAQAAVGELSEHLSRAQQLLEALQARERHLAEQRQSLEEQMAELLQRQARLGRQRKETALRLRAQKAEMLLELENRRAELQPTPSQAQSALEQQLAECLASNQRLEAKLESLQPDASATLAMQRQIEELQQQLSASQQELVSVQLGSDLLTGTAGSDDRVQLANALAESQRELLAAQERLSEMEQQSAEWLSETQRVAAAADVGESERVELECQVRRLEEELQRAQQPREHADHPSISAEQLELMSEMEQQLSAMRAEMMDLQEQNSDLAAQVARHQVQSSGHAPHVAFDQQSLSWEERKKLIMQQLESEGEEESSGQHETARVEIEQVLATTQREIERRDQEIAELHSIIEQQSDTRQGVAIGAAAIAQMFDADELVQQERQKLKEIQQQWEEKLRQAEIDLSMERARLARERSQLEAAVELAKSNSPPPPLAEGECGQTRKRKWLEHLGLKEENRDA